MITLPIRCTEIPEGHPCRSLLGRPIFTYPQILPRNTEIDAEELRVSFSLLNTLEPAPRDECREFAKYVSCQVAVPPCDEESDLPLQLCEDSCRASTYLDSTGDCDELNQRLKEVVTGTTSLEFVFNLYSNFNCSNSSTYFFGEEEFASEKCTNLFDPMVQGECL